MESRAPSPLDFTGDVSENWKRWKDRFELYSTAIELQAKPEYVQCAQLLLQMGEEAIEIFKNFNLSNEDKNAMHKIKEKFDNYFTPKEDLTRERYKFFSARQSRETLEQFATTLKELAEKCEFTDGKFKADLIKMMLIVGIKNVRLRTFLLDMEYTLEQAIEICNLAEQSKPYDMFKKSTDVSNSTEHQDANLKALEKPVDIECQDTNQQDMNVLKKTNGAEHQDANSQNRKDPIASIDDICNGTERLNSNQQDKNDSIALKKPVDVCNGSKCQEVNVLKKTIDITNGTEQQDGNPQNIKDSIALNDDVHNGAEPQDALKKNVVTVHQDANPKNITITLETPNNVSNGTECASNKPIDISNGTQNIIDLIIQQLLVALYNESGLIQQSNQQNTNNSLLQNQNCNVKSCEVIGKTIFVASFRYSISQFSKVKETVVSPPYYVANLPWKIMAKAKTSEQAPDSRGLAFYLQCNGESKCSSWSCRAVAILRLLSVRNDVQPVSKKIERLFCSKDNNWGFAHFMEWNDVLDTEKGYIKDDTITLEVLLVVQAPQGEPRENTNNSTGEKRNSKNDINNNGQQNILQSNCVSNSVEINVDTSRPKTTFRFTVHGISKLETYVVSPTVIVRHLNWQIYAEVSNDEQSLEIGLRCSSSLYRTWTCKVKLVLTLLSVRTDVRFISFTHDELQLTTKNNYYGKEVIGWNILLDPLNGYIKDDVITIEASIQADEVVLRNKKRKLYN